MSIVSSGVTVLMPAYNTGKYIAQAIDSVLRQTFSDFELLIIDDGSTDNTLEIIKSYDDVRIKVVSRTNKGLIDTLNEGLGIANGDIIIRMDSDDVCLPNRLQRQVSFLSENPDYVLVGSEADVIDKDGNFLFKLEAEGKSYEQIKALINSKCPFIHPSVAFRKEVVVKAGGYPKNALTFEDHLLWKELLNLGKVCNLDEVLILFRFNPESVTIDEKWRGPAFIEIRKRSIANGYVSSEDAGILKDIIAGQNFGAYKQASYYAMVGKKYLWNNPNRALARKHFIKAIKFYPGNKQLYALWLLSFLPAGLIKKLYSTFKKNV